MQPPKPFSQACERNRGPILAVLREHFAHASRVLEVGSGTGQHAVHFAGQLPHLCWQTSDRPEYHAGIQQWLHEAKLPNVLAPITLDVNGPWPASRYDAVFSANTLHIMSWQEVQRFFSALPGVLAPAALLVIYGPFNYGGSFSSPSNEAFDASLKLAQAHAGLRDFEAVNALAESIGLQLLHDYPMPANNRCLVWQSANA